VTTINSAGEPVGALIDNASTISEALVGDRIGRLAPLITLNQTRESLTGTMVGTLMLVNDAVREVIAGKSVGINIKPQLMSVVREIIGRDSSYYFETGTREVLASAPNDLVSIAWSMHGLRQAVTQGRPTTALPHNVWSATPIPQLRELIAQRNMRMRPISMESNVMLRAQVAQKRPAPPPANVLSPMRVPSVRQLAVKSRSIPYNPVSGNFTYINQQLVAMKRAGLQPPSTVHAAASVAGERQLIVQSKRSGYQLLSLQLVELVLTQRNVTFSAPTTVASEVQVVAQKRTTPGSQRSTMYAGSELQQAVQQRATPGILRSAITQQTLTQMAVADRGAVVKPVSTTALYQQAQQIVQLREPITYASIVYFEQQRALVVQHRIPGPLPYTGESARSMLELVVQFRETPPPNATSDWRITQQQQLVVAAKVTDGIVRGQIEVRHQGVQYTLAAKYPAPIDVIGPELGAQIKAGRQLAVQRRVTERPSMSTQSRYVRQVAQQPVLGDSFDDKGTAYADADAFSVVQQVALVDQPWPSPLLADSTVDAFTVLSVAAVVDQPWPDPSVPLSDGVVRAMHEVVVLGGQYADARVPVSEVAAFTVTEFAALGDAQFPDPLTPLSEVRSWHVAALCAIGDADLVGQFGMSEIRSTSLAQFLVIPDRSLVGIPLRKGPRPRISVSRM
jgi:hypothetical protein